MPTITTGKFLKKEDCSEEGDIHTIKHVREENIAQEGKPEDLKWVMYFDGLKPLILNTTNINRCIQAFKTNESEEWEGQRIVVYADPDIQFGGKTVGGVRLRATKRERPGPGSKPVSPVPDDDSDPVPF